MLPSKNTVIFIVFAIDFHQDHNFRKFFFSKILFFKISERFKNSEEKKDEDKNPKKHICTEINTKLIFFFFCFLQ